MINEHCYYNFITIARKQRINFFILKIKMSKTFRIHRLKTKTIKYINVNNRRR